MKYIGQILNNRILAAGVIGWLSAQTVKTLLYAVVNKKFDPTRFFGDGGMPSAHSATVTAVAFATGMKTGFDSPLFAVACMTAIVVMHDASGVRLETGKQAKVINELLVLFGDLGKKDLSPEAKLKEFVGHTHLQVLAGFATGLVSAVLFLCL